jgi:hypothetical protein
VSISRQEEIIACLWIIAAVIAFGHGFTVWGWIFAVKGVSDTLCAIGFSVKEIIEERKRSSPDRTVQPKEKS